MALQPSPAFLLPSSHCSPGSCMPLPHSIGLPASMLGISGREPSPFPPVPGPPLPLLPSTPVPCWLTPAQPTEKESSAAPTRETKDPLRIGGLLGWVRPP